MSSAEIVVFRDGVARVTQIFGVNETTVTISLALLSPSVGNVLVLDQANMPLSYEVTPPTIAITTLGASKVTLEYLSSTLTQKEGEVWTLKFSIPHSATVTLPDQASIIYINELPASISAQGDKTVLAVTQGLWEVSYILPLPPQTTKPTTTATTTTPTPVTTSTQTVTETTTPETDTTAPTSKPVQPTAAAPLPFEYLTVAVVVVAIVVSAVLFQRRRGSVVSVRELRPEDREVLKFIAEKGGKVLESELRQRFVLPKSSMWRLAKRLERMGYVRISKVGVQNEIELVRGG